MNLIKNILLIFYLTVNLYFFSTIFYKDWNHSLFVKMVDVVYLYNLFYIFIVASWLIDYKFKVPNKQMGIATILFLIGIVIIIGATLYDFFEGADGMFPLN